MERGLTTLVILVATTIFVFVFLLHFISKKAEKVSFLDKFSLFALVTTVIYFLYQMFWR